MQYDIKLSGTPFDDGAIDLDRLNGTMAYVEIAKVSLAAETDTYFSRTPRRETAAQQSYRNGDRHQPQ